MINSIHMKNTSLIFGLSFIAVILLSFKTEMRQIKERNETISALFEDIINPFEETLKKQGDVIMLNPITDLKVIEVPEEIELGVEVFEYLPIGFDAYKGFQWDPADLNVIEVEEDVELGFDVQRYLPENFDPFKG